MGLGGVTIAALHAVMCLEVPFSDGLGGRKRGFGIPGFRDFYTRV